MMLFEYHFTDHPVNQVQDYISAYLKKLKQVGGKRKQFSINLCHEDFQSYVKKSHLLKKHLKVFFHAFIQLAAEERELVFRAFYCTGKIKEQLENTEECYPITSIPQEIREPAKALFKYMYENTLNSVGDIKDHYKQFYKKHQSHICPFCGIEEILHYDHYKQDYDHLLCKKIYPFAAVNMENLVPMGRNCNTINKKDKDLIHNDDGYRRKYFYPFSPNEISITVKLTGSCLPPPVNHKGNWIISLLPDIEEVRTWDAVFDIRRRYRDVVFEDEYNGWLYRFINIARNYIDIGEQCDENRIKEILTIYLNTLSRGNNITNYYYNKTFLKYSLFEFLRDEAGTAFFSFVSKMIMAG